MTGVASDVPTESEEVADVLNSETSEAEADGFEDLFTEQAGTSAEPAEPSSEESPKD